MTTLARASRLVAGIVLGRCAEAGLIASTPVAKTVGKPSAAAAARVLTVCEFVGTGVCG